MLCHILADLNDVLARSYENNVEKIMITGGCLSDCQEAIKLAKTDGECQSQQLLGTLTCWTNWKHFVYNQDIQFVMITMTSKFNLVTANNVAALSFVKQNDLRTGTYYYDCTI